MQLSEQDLHAISKEARNSLRDCLKILKLHDRSKERAFLNPPALVAAVVAWEQFANNLVGASTSPKWEAEKVEHDPDDPIAWPGSHKDMEAVEKTGNHILDHRLMNAGVLSSPLTSQWNVHVATGHGGSDPHSWLFAEYSNIGNAKNPQSMDALNARWIRAGILGAKSARDAFAHGIYYKKARQADHIDMEKWCYTWASDNHIKKGVVRGKPTIQNGYVRGAAALFIQLIDSSIATIQEYNGWHSKQSRLPAKWFNPSITEGSFNELKLWNGKRLHRK